MNPTFARRNAEALALVSVPGSVLALALASVPGSVVT